MIDQLDKEMVSYQKTNIITLPRHSFSQARRHHQTTINLFNGKQDQINDVDGHKNTFGTVLPTNQQPNLVSSRDLMMSMKSSSTTTTPTMIMGLISLQWAGGDDKNEDNRISGDRNSLSSTISSFKTFSKPVTDIWRWKDILLGEGVDYFITKPKTSIALQSYFVQQFHSMTENRYHMKECILISNCARFEILFVIEPQILSSISQTNSSSLFTSSLLSNNINSSYHVMKNDTNSQHKLDEKIHEISQVVIESISQALLQQVSYFQKHVNGFDRFQLSLLDNPRIIQECAKQRYCNDSYDNVKEVSKYWDVIIGIPGMIRHLAYISAGMAIRPRRPHRLIVFQPFSSRDAHILLQLKRIYDIASSLSSGTPCDHDYSNNEKDQSKGNSKLISKLLRYALQAGKAARNPTIVPILTEYQKRYGLVGNSPKYDILPPKDFLQQVVADVQTLAIEPIILECCESFYDMLYVKQNIILLREQSIKLAQPGQLHEIKYINQRLHEPTMLVRRTMLASTSSNDKTIVSANHMNHQSSIFDNIINPFLHQLEEELHTMRREVPQ